MCCGQHLTCWSIFRAKESWDYTTTPLYRIIAFIQYLLFGAGPLATNVGAFLRQTSCIYMPCNYMSQKGDAAAFIRLEDQR
jgi:hypothetical protein